MRAGAMGSLGGLEVGRDHDRTVADATPHEAARLQLPVRQRHRGAAQLEIGRKLALGWQPRPSWMRPSLIAASMEVAS